MLGPPSKALPRLIIAVTGNLSGDLDTNGELHENDNPDQQHRESREGTIIELDAKFVPLPEDDAVAWLSSFINDGLDRVQQEQRKKEKQTGMMALCKYYGTDFAKKDQTGERASEEIHNEIKRLESSIKPFSHEDKYAPVLAGGADISFERETQVFAIHGMKMLEAGIAQLSGNNYGM
ncbi:MAG: hypothetical protein EZS28_036615, partial [Streblomastix strix]